MPRQLTILLIDFGFFFSNAPGKGLTFEQNVPFKLLSEYIEILGVSIANCSMNSEDYFSSKYIQMIFRGFMAARK